MAAAVVITRWTGDSNSPTKVNITGINTRANAEDAHTISGTTNSILVPAVGFNYSYWVSTRLSISAINQGTVDNLRWYTDGTNNFGTGITCIGNSASSYTQATGTTGQTGIQLNPSVYPSLASSPVDVFSFTSSSPKSVPGSASSAGDFGDFFVYQIEVASSAQSGATSQEVFTWKYDDTSA